MKCLSLLSLFVRFSCLDACEPFFEQMILLLTSVLRFNEITHCCILQIIEKNVFRMLNTKILPYICICNKKKNILSDTMKLN